MTIPCSLTTAGMIVVCSSSSRSLSVAGVTGVPLPYSCTDSSWTPDSTVWASVITTTVVPPPSREELVGLPQSRLETASAVICSRVRVSVGSSRRVWKMALTSCGQGGGDPCPHCRVPSSGQPEHPLQVGVGAGGPVAALLFLAFDPTVVEDPFDEELDVATEPVLRHPVGDLGEVLVAAVELAAHVGVEVLQGAGDDVGVPSRQLT